MQKERFKDLCGTFTEEQMKIETSRCLGCGAAVVDESLCVGCGICTTKCKFDAIHLEKVTDYVGAPYFKALLGAAGNAPAAVAKLVTKKIARKQGATIHEIGVVRSMAKTVTDFAEQNDIKEVAEIVLDIGELSLVIPKYVKDIYPVVVGDTWLKDTKLVINVIEHEGYCPNCGSFEKTILSGKDFLIREIHIPED